MQHKQNLIKLAVQAAGGRHTVAARMGVGHQTVAKWWQAHRVPSTYILRLCAMGGNIITPEQLLAYIEEHASAAAEKAEA